MAKKYNGERKTQDQLDHGWNPQTNPELKELLDHVAEELAHEYVRLMKQAEADSDADDKLSEGSK